MGDSSQQVVAARAEGTSSGSASAQGGEPTKLIDKLEHGTAKQRPSRFLQRRDTETQVDRLISTKFSDFNSTAIDGRTIEGKTLRQHLFDERKKRKSDNGRIPAKVLSDLRAKFASDETPAKMLKVSDGKKEPPNADLVKALTSAYHSNPAKRSRTPLYAYFATATSVSETELVGLCKSIASTSPSSSIASRRHICEVMKFISHTNGDIMFPGHIRIMRSVFDECLSLLWLDSKKSGEALAVWWSAHKCVARMVLDCTLVDRVMEEQGSWAAVRKEVEAVVGGSQLGQRLFWKAHGAITIESFSQQVEKTCQMFASMAVVEEGFFQEQKDKLLKLAASHQEGLAAEFVRRQVQMSYMGTSISVEVVDLRDEVDYRLSCMVKQASSGRSGGLTAFLPEGYLVSQASLATPSSMPEALWSKYRRFREAANSFLKSQGCECGKDLVRAFQSKLMSFSAMDRTCSIEYNWLAAMSQEGGSKILESQVLAELPSVSWHPGLDSCIAALQKIQTSELYRFVNISAQGGVNTSVELLQDLRRAAFNPGALKAAAGFMASVLSHMEWFAVFTKEGKELFGREAMEANYVSVFAKGDEQPVTLKELELLTRFRWLLSEPQGQKLDASISAILLGGQASGSTASSASGSVLPLASGGQAKKKKAKKEAKQQGEELSLEDDLANVMGWFS